MKIKPILEYHLLVSFVGFWCGLIGGLLSENYFFWIIFGYCGISGIIIALTNRYWDKGQST